MSMPDPIVLLDARARYVHPAFQMSRASTKTVFDSAGRLATVPPNALGWDHDPATGQIRGYANEPSRTNTFVQSVDLSQSNWGKRNASIQSGADAAPDGTTMFNLVENSSTEYHAIYQEISYSAGDMVCVSVFAKAAERAGIELRLSLAGDSVDAGLVRFDLVTGQAQYTNAGTNYTPVDMGAEAIGRQVWRVWAVFSVDATATARVSIGLVNNSGNAWYQGDGSSGALLWGPQAEEGSYPTSYIATGAATATRIDDQLSFLNIGDASWFNPKAGTMLLDMWYLQRIANSIFWVLDRPGFTSLYLRVAGNVNDPRLVTQNTNVGQEVTILSAPSFTPQSRYLVAVSWDTNGVYSSVNGRSVVGGDMGNLPGGNLYVGWTSASWARYAHADFARLIYYPQRLSNADLQSLTAIQE